MAVTEPATTGMAPPAHRSAPSRSDRLPDWWNVLAVVAHPDDESFGLGAVIDTLTSKGATVNVLCYTHGEASTLNETGADLRSARQQELRQATAALGAAGFTLLDYPDGALARVDTGELGRHIADLTTRLRPDGLLVFDDTGITGHPDHKTATSAAVQAGSRAGLPVLGWTLPSSVARQLSDETGAPFAGRPPDHIDMCVRVGRGTQRRAALLHATQISPSAVLWRRLQLQGDCEHLRWLVPPSP